MAEFTRRFELAIAKAATLPPDDQDALAALLLAEIDAAQGWEDRFADDRSPRVLKRLAAEAIAEDAAGVTEPLDGFLAEIEELLPTAP